MTYERSNAIGSLVLQGRSSFGTRLRALRLARGLSQVELARLIGRHQTVIGPYERDEYEPPREVVERLAALLDTSAEYLYFGRSPRRTLLSVAGRVGPGGLVDGEEAAFVELREAHLLGYRVLDDSMSPVFRPGQLVMAAASPSDAPHRHLGQDVLAELADKRVLLRRLMPAASPTLVDLVAYNAPTLPSVSVISVRAIVGVLWPEAWSMPGDQLEDKG